MASPTLRMDGTGRIPVVAGLVVGVAFVVLFATLFSSSSSQVQDDVQINSAAAELKGGGYIDPKRKAQLESVELDLRQRVSELRLDGYAVNLNPQTGIIEVITNDPTKNEEVRALFDKYASGIPIKLTNSDIGVVDFPCAGQSDDCNLTD